MIISEFYTESHLSCHPRYNLLLLLCKIWFNSNHLNIVNNCFGFTVWLFHILFPKRIVTFRKIQTKKNKSTKEGISDFMSKSVMEYYNSEIILIKTASCQSLRHTYLSDTCLPSQHQIYIFWRVRLFLIQALGITQTIFSDNQII